ncbi:hypothetical protein DPMN_114109 [Dreissena polymorpha]|uniref:Uncharacterized protein n=1 Tax=Dreissena polymorpha TaxID=45954 RepID=A0A9D4KJF0_DREPO|nr:hypothetical protein DPMN_114109 [Dreissena polymorpha]
MFDAYGKRLIECCQSSSLIIGNGRLHSDRDIGELSFYSYSGRSVERRKKLIPYLEQARQQGKDASLSYDVLYIDRVRYTHVRPLPDLVPELPQHHNRNRPNAYPATGRRSGP